MADSAFAVRFGDLIDMTPGERRTIAALEERPRPLRRGATLVRENDLNSDMFIVLRGTLMSYVLLDDGSRQILRFLFPGDVIGLSTLAYRRAVETISAVSEAVVSSFDRGMMSAILSGHPRLAGTMLAMAQMERATLTDRLAALGRTSARARVAALLMEIRHNVAAADRSPQPEFALGLTQEEIGDATGLTAVHVNRMLRQLEDDRLIAREAGRITLLDEARLIRIGNYVNRFEGLDLGWLPAAAAAL